MPDLETPRRRPSNRWARAQEGYISTLIRSRARNCARTSARNGGAPSPTPPRRRLGVEAGHAHYKWWALSCTSLGMLLATINSGTLIIALPTSSASFTPASCRWCG